MPSTVVVLESTAQHAQIISALLERAAENIKQHNALVANLVSEKTKVVGEAWKYLVEESKDSIQAYTKAKGDLEKAIENLDKGINDRRTALAQIKREIIALERSKTSVQPTVDAINGILTQFGFTSFSLAPDVEGGNDYRIVRADGSDAHKTLSDGEKSFITFLYFFHQIFGSTAEGSINTDRIVVFDDPVSSMDSDVLFIVSTLIKRVMKEACDGNTPIKQVFIFTHNTYFHRQVSFRTRSEQGRKEKETYWIIRKQNDRSALTPYKDNPIKTSYDLLWAEVRGGQPTIGLQNTLRRILENYFTILGGLRDFDDLASKFEGKDKLIYASLFSWAHDGSHSVFDDINIAVEDSGVEHYLCVFEQIFEKSGHIAHYDMMMRKSEPATQTTLAVEAAA